MGNHRIDIRGLDGNIFNVKGLGYGIQDGFRPVGLHGVIDAGDAAFPGNPGIRKIFTDIGLLDAGDPDGTLMDILLLQGIQRTVVKKLSAGKDYCVVTDFINIIQIVTGEEYADALFLIHLPQKTADGMLDINIQADSRLVQV